MARLIFLNYMIMNRVPLFAAIALPFLLLLGCNQAEKTRIAQLESQLDSVNSVSQQQSQTIEEFFASINQIEADLNRIRQQERTIGQQVENVTHEELQTDKRILISDNIIAINEIMHANRQKLASLQEKLKRSNLQVTQFQQMIANTERKIAERDSTIGLLKSHLEQLNFSMDSLNLVVDTLSRENFELNATLTEREIKLNEAWYAVGSKDELVENGVIVRRGGVKKYSELKQDFNMEYFTKIHIESTGEIPLIAGKKGVEIATNHPSSSYKLVTNEQGLVVKLVIEDKEAFWRASRFLVVVIR